MKLENDNLIRRVNQDGEIVIEPSYVDYLRNQGYIIESVGDCRAIQSNSESNKSYLIVEFETYRYPRTHPRLDYAEHQQTVRACSCWAYRDNCNNVEDGEPPGGTCKHIRRTYREEKAKQDDQQQRLNPVGK